MAIMTGHDVQKLKATMDPREIAFCENYIINFNGAASAIAAGYAAGHGATVQAVRVLARANAQKYLMYLKQKRAKKTGVTAERVVKELAKIAFQDIRTLVDYDNTVVSIKSFEEIGKGTKIIKKIKVKTEKNSDGAVIGYIEELECHDKLKALELLGKHTAVFTENVNLTNDGGKFEAAQQVNNVAINYRRKGDDLEAPEVAEDYSDLM